MLKKIFELVRNKTLNLRYIMIGRLPIEETKALVIDFHCLLLTSAITQAHNMLVRRAVSGKATLYYQQFVHLCYKDALLWFHFDSKSTAWVYLRPNIV